MPKNEVPAREDQCRSMVRFHMRREDVVVYLRCRKDEDHEGRWHESWVKKWTDEEEDGWFEDDDA